MWKYRTTDADWAITGPHFCPSILGGGMPVYSAKASRGRVAWNSVDRVYFHLNEPNQHWALAELEFSTGLITVYDSMAPRKRNKLPPVENRKWWIDMRATMAEQLPKFLDKIGVLKRRGLAVESYKITYRFEDQVPHQGDAYGDCGIWVCLLLYRLTRKIPLVFPDPLQVGLAYRERMLDYFWKYKVSYKLPASDDSDSD